MNKKLKITLAVAATLIVAGVLAFVIGMSSLGWDFNRLDSTEYTAESYAAAADSGVTRVELDVDSFPIEIVKGDAVALDYYKASNSDVIVSCENGVLSVREQYNYMPFKTGLFGFGRSSRKYRLTLTDGVTECFVKGGNGNITLVGMNFDELDIASTNTRIVLSDCDIRSFSVDCTNLTMIVKNCKLGTVVADGTNADIEIIGCNGDGASISGTNLDIVVSGSSFAQTTIDGTNCGVVVKDGTYDKLSVVGTNGDYRLKNIFTDALKVRATNLDAVIEINGKAAEYTVKTHGRGMPPERIGSTDKTIELSGTNNDVKLIFTEG